MAKLSPGKLVTSAVVAGIIVLSGLLFGPAEQRAHGQAKELTKVFFGIDACKKCHDDTKSAPNDEALLYRGTEMDIWLKNDKHKDATTVLEKDLGKQIGTILGWKVTEDARCVNCHGIHITEDSKKNIDAATFGQLAQRQKSGVSCVVCHGEYKEWVQAHALPLGSDWKKLNRTQKKELGLRDLWDPEERAELCCSCHIGNVKQGKVVTHQMYAAGHPPLPGFEIATFSNAMPRHWELLGEKVQRTRNKDFYRGTHDFDAGQEEQTRMLVISAVVAFRESVRLIDDLASQKIQGYEPGEQSWPELAVFDCYACHHDLKKDSWRQKRGYTGIPGRPQMRPWTETLLLPAVHFAGADVRQEAVAKLKELQVPFNKVPFGNPQSVAGKARELTEWSKKVLDKLKSRQYKKKDTHAFLADLGRIPEKKLLDFDSARQLSWAFLLLLHDDGREPYEWKKEPAPPVPHIQQLSAKYPDLKTSLDDLNEQLKLSLPQGQVTIAKDFLPDALRRISDWNPENFSRRIQELAKKVPRK